MATYKVLQDIEAEDKLVGPFSLRQFIYAAIAVVSAFIAFKLLTVSIFLVIPFLPVVVLFGVLAAPFGHDQPSEVWLLARVRFFLKPHKRIWDQSGMINLVTITVPKVVQRNLTKNLTQSEVSSRLTALANTIDSRGWAVKNVNVNLTNQSVAQTPVASDRLINPQSLPQDVPGDDVTAADDILDGNSNPTAAHLDQMIASATKQQHQQIVQKMNSGMDGQTKQTTNPDYWFMNDSAQSNKYIPNSNIKFGDDPVIIPGTDRDKIALPPPPADDKLLSEELESHKDHAQDRNGHMRVIEPLGEQAKHKDSNASKKNNQTNQESITDPAIIDLAWADKDNWSVATIAHQAQEAKKKQPPQDEVVISLH